MIYRLTLNNSRKSIERHFSRNFRYGHLYRPQLIINGLQESNLAIVCSHDPSDINIGIWGLLPENFMGDWRTFQERTNTLNFQFDDFKQGVFPSYLRQAPNRCLIIVNGYIVSTIENNYLVDYHVKKNNHEPFALAGVCNQLDDGFYSCAPLIQNTKADYNISALGKEPITLASEEHAKWLNPQIPISELLLTEHSSTPKLVITRQTQFSGPKQAVYTNQNHLDQNSKSFFLRV